MSNDTRLYSSQPTRVEHVKAGAKRLPMHNGWSSLRAEPPRLPGLWARQPIKGIFLTLKALRVTIVDLFVLQFICDQRTDADPFGLHIRPVCAVYYAFYRPRPTWSWKDAMGCYTINQLMQAGASYRPICIPASKTLAS